MSDPTALRLRQRATALRALASSIERGDAIDLRRRAGPDVWIGPTAGRCHDELTAFGRRLVAAADELHERARALDRRAAEIEAIAAVTVVRA